MMRKWLTGTVVIAGLAGFPLLAAAQANNPGCILMVDPPGDQNTQGVANTDPSLDILSMGIASEGDNVAFYLEMSTLESPPANTSWPMMFRDSDGVEWRVMMETDAGGAVSFNYFKNPEVTVPSVTSAGYGYLVNRTSALPESNYTPDGLISIFVAASDLESSAGDVFDQFLVRVTSPRHPGGGGVTPDNAPDDLVRTGTYTVGGSCTRSLHGDVQASARAGSAPFQAHFDASRSSGDDIAGYRFDFGDGTQLVSASPFASHVYARPGDYEVSLRPMNSAGDFGKAATTTISVAGSQAGAPGLCLLLGLGLLGLAGRMGPPGQRRSSP